MQGLTRQAIEAVEKENSPEYQKRKRELEKETEQAFKKARTSTKDAVSKAIEKESVRQAKEHVQTSLQIEKQRMADEINDMIKSHRLQIPLAKASDPKPALVLKKQDVEKAINSGYFKFIACNTILKLSSGIETAAEKSEMWLGFDLRCPNYYEKTLKSMPAIEDCLDKIAKTSKIPEINPWHMLMFIMGSNFVGCYLERDKIKPITEASENAYSSKYKDI